MTGKACSGACPSPFPLPLSYPRFLALPDPIERNEFRMKIGLTSAATYLLCTASLSAAAIWNGYPLVYSDSGTYLHAFIARSNPPDRPIFYSVFAGLLHWQTSTWPIVAMQALIVVAILALTLRTLLPQSSHGLLLTIVGLLTLTSSLPWYTGQIMPDIFAAVTILAVYLAVMGRDSLVPGVYWSVLLLLCVAQSVHYTHIALTIGLLLAYALGSAFLPVIRLRNLMPVAVTTGLALLALYSVNYLQRGELVMAPYRPIFLLGRLFEYGTAQEYLRTTCPTSRYIVCNHLDQLPASSGQFIWGTHGNKLLKSLGGPEAYRAEASQLVSDIVWNAPLKHVRLALQATVAQFFDFATGTDLRSYGPDEAIYRVIAEFFPNELAAYSTSRQYTGRIDTRLLNSIDVPIGYLSLAFGAALLIAAAARDTRVFVFLCTIAAGLIGNAFLCGAFSVVLQRYQSRVIWLAPFGVLVGLVRLRQELWPRATPPGPTPSFRRG